MNILSTNQWIAVALLLVGSLSFKYLSKNTFVKILQALCFATILSVALQSWGRTPAQSFLVALGFLAFRILDDIFWDKFKRAKW